MFAEFIGVKKFIAVFEFGVAVKNKVFQPYLLIYFYRIHAPHIYLVGVGFFLLCGGCSFGLALVLFGDSGLGRLFLFFNDYLARPVFTGCGLFIGGHGGDIIVLGFDIRSAG